MWTVVKAILIAVLIFTLPLWMLIIGPLISFAALVFLIWFLLKIFQDEPGKDTDTDDPGPP